MQVVVLRSERFVDAKHGDDEDTLTAYAASSGKERYPSCEQRQQQRKGSRIIIVIPEMVGMGGLMR